MSLWNKIKFKRGGRTMKRKTWMGVAVVAFVLALGSLAGAADTSPYLIGVWEANDYGYYGQYAVTDYVVVNPTTIKLKVYAAFFENDGTPTDVCFWKILNPNAKWHIPQWVVEEYLSNSGYMGTVKFIAFPATATRLVFDSNAVIGGYQNRYFWVWYNDTTSVAQADLKGVAINLYTQGEVKIVAKDSCMKWQEEPADGGPQTNLSK